MNFLERGSNPPSHTYGFRMSKNSETYDYINRMPIGHTLDIVYSKLENLKRFRRSLEALRNNNKKVIRLKTKLIKGKNKFILRIVKVEPKKYE